MGEAVAQATASLGQAPLLRLVTAGSVDDGKSTLIGRLLLDSKSIFDDQLQAVERASRRVGADYTNLALLTDGLRAEREQGITIDVAYRYFATPGRTFIIADTPGHVQYTRNMVTGASTADVALVLVDARKGLLEQSRRHAFIASLLGIRHIVLCVNKMDLVGYDEAVFETIASQFRLFADGLDGSEVVPIPLCALHGDNVVSRSARTPWYGGPSLLSHLETVAIPADRHGEDARFPVQYVLRPHSHESQHHDYRGYAGTVAGGVLGPNDDVVVLPSGFTSTIRVIEAPDGPVAVARPAMSVVLTLADEIDVSRGDMLCRPNRQPSMGQELDAMVCWLTEQSSLRVGDRYALKHTTRWARALVEALDYRLEVNTLRYDATATELRLNDIGRIRLRATKPLMYDPYHRNRATGSFILVHESTNSTVAAGMIVGP